MAKIVKAKIKLQIQGASATPAPPVGSSLGQHQVNIMEFCKAFNAQTQTPEKQGKPLPVVITVYEDRSFSFITKTPPATYLIKEALKLQKGSSNPNTNKVGKITRKQLAEIAEIKMPDLTASNLEAAMRNIAGSARSMGVDVEGA